MDIAPQTADRQCIRRQHHGAEQLRRELDVPALAVGLLHLGAPVMEQRGLHLFQLPVVALVLGTTGEAGGLQLALFVELVAGHADQLAARLHGVDVHVLLALAMPQAMPGTLRLTAALGQRPMGLGLVLAPGRQVLADQHTDQHQHQHGLHHRPDDAPDRHAGSAHDGQFAVAGQAAEADQAADQRGHRQHLVGAPRQGQHHVDQCLQGAVAVAEVAQLVDEGKQQGQADDDAEHREDGQEDTGTDIAVELMHGPSP